MLTYLQTHAQTDKDAQLLNPVSCFSLTAWPLVRDVFFYSVSLIVLVLFFSDNYIQWWEALILFLWYGAYVSFMKFNEPAEDAVRKLLRLEPTVSFLPCQIPSFWRLYPDSRVSFYHTLPTVASTD